MENIKKKMTPDIIILVNGPGELASYVKPVVSSLNNRKKDIRIIIVFTPCPYSTGKELEIARKLPGVYRVISVNEFISWALWQKKPENISFSSKGVVLYLGGDILYGKMIARKLKYPAYAYTEAYAKWPKIYKKYLVPDQHIFNKFVKQGFPKDKIDIVGNLMVDSISIHKTDFSGNMVSFLPGSRAFQVQFTFLFFARTAYEMFKQNISLSFSYIISPYLPLDVFDKYMKKNGFSVVNGAIRYKEMQIKIISSDQQKAIADSKLIITIPGTNTAEVAVIGTPMIVVFPDDSSQMIPLEGIFDIIGKLPVLGYFLKKLYVKIALRLTKFFAIPNIKSGREIVPELKGSIKPLDIAVKALSLLKNEARLSQMNSELLVSLGSPGAADKITKEIFNELIY